MSLIYKGQTIANVGGAGGGGGVPKGTIAIWSGAQDAIPSGWAFCDGTNGTPDLRDKFVLGAGEEFTVGATGGEEEHTLTIDEMPKHSHRLFVATVEAGMTAVGAQNSSANMSNSTVTAGNSKPHNNMPPYYALCYIMKMTDGGSGSGSGSSEEVYSTEETRIGTWIDGKPLYRKSAVLTINSVAKIHEFPVEEFSVDNVDTLVRIDGAMLDRDNHEVSAFGYNPDVDCVYGPRIVYDRLRVYRANANWHKTISVVVEYTKTTDEAAS